LRNDVDSGSKCRRPTVRTSAACARFGNSPLGAAQRYTGSGKRLNGEIGLACIEPDMNFGWQATCSQTRGVTSLPCRRVPEFHFDQPQLRFSPWACRKCVFLSARDATRWLGSGCICSVMGLRRTSYPRILATCPTRLASSFLLDIPVTKGETAGSLCIPLHVPRNVEAGS